MAPPTTAVNLIGCIGSVTIPADLNEEQAMKPTPPGWPRISSSICYEDPAKAIDWLCNAFGFEVRLKVEGDDGSILHAELVFGEGLIMHT
jgi:hypothetical protein